MKKEQKLFAFKLANKAQAEAKDTKWKARDGVAVAGCSEVGPFPGIQKYPDRYGNSDQGWYC